MLSDEQIDVLSEALMPYFDELEQWVIQDIARRLDETLTYSGTIENELAAMKRLGYSPTRMRRGVMKLLGADKNLKKLIAEQTAEYKRKYAEMMERINREAAKTGADMVYKASDIAQAEDRKIWNESGKKLKEGDFLHQLSDAFSERMDGDLVNLTKTSGFKRGMSYMDARQAYTHTLNNSVLRLASGVSTIEREVTSVIHDMAQSGLRTINYSANRSQHIESAVRTALRTTYSQLSGAVMDKDIKQTGETLVYVSQHWGARNKGEGIENHEEWQGKVYKLDDREYPEEEKRIGQKITGLVEATGYDAATSTVMDPRGLHGYNCRHSHNAWFEGVSVKPEYKPEPSPKEIDGKVYDYYAMTQKMRSMERDIRAMRKELIALKDLNMDADRQQELKKDIEKKLDAYQEFCDKCGIPPKYERTRVEKAGTDIKKTQAYKDYEKMEREAQETSREEDGKILIPETQSTLNLIGEIDPEKLEEAIEYYGELIRNNETECLFVFDKDGKVYYNQGKSDYVDIGDFDLNGCVTLHNHPASNGIVSFGSDDFDIMKKYQRASYRLVNPEYNYELEIVKPIDELTYNQIYMGGAQECFETGDDMQHCAMNYLQKEGYVVYDRKRAKR
jgi:hypothetical protein